MLEQKLKAEEWLQNFAVYKDLTYEELMDAANNWENHEEYLCDGGKFEGEYIPDEFWDHYEIVTGKGDLRRGNFFTCSC